MSGWKEKARGRVKQKQSGGQFKPGEDENIVRILPNPKGEDFAPFLEFRSHREVGPDKRMIRCGKDIFGKGKCWLCKKSEELQNSGNRAKIAHAAAMAPVDRMICQVAVLNQRTGKLEGPFVWYLSANGGKSLGIQLQALLAKEGRSYEHPVKGRNLSLTRTGQGLQTRYSAFEPEDEPTKVPTDILEKLKPLEELLPGYSEEDQKDAYFGRKRRDDEEESKIRHRTRVQEDVDEEEDEEDEEGDSSKKKGKAMTAPKRRPAAVDEEEGEEEEDEEEDESEEDEEEEDEEEDESEEDESEEDEEEEDEEDEEGEEEDEEDKEDEEGEEEDEEDEEGEEEDEEDEEGEEEDEEEDEGEPAPKKKGRPVKTSSKPVSKKTPQKPVSKKAAAKKMAKRK